MAQGTSIFLQNRDFFGAMVVHVPLFDALREAGGGVVAYTPFERGRIFQRLGLAQETRLYSGAGAALWRELRQRRLERIILLRPKSFGLTAVISMAGAQRTIGYTTALSKLAFTRTIRRDTAIYRARNYMALVAGEVPAPPFRQTIQRLAQQSAHRSVEGGIVLMPCGSFECKLWGERNFAELAQRIAERDRQARFVLVLGGGEQRYVEVLERAGLGSRTTSLVDADLPDIARAVLGARVVVANDCGPNHVAQLSGAPVVSLFGNWDGAAPARIAEWFDPRPGARCLTTRTAAPIISIAVEDVLAAVSELEADPQAPGRVVQVEAGVECAAAQ